MIDKPRILWIDDVYGKAQDGHNIDRDILCSDLGLQDITGDCLSQEEPNDDREINGQVDKENHDDEVVADVIFYRGQAEAEGFVINDLESTLEVVRKGWEQPPRWSLLLLDMHFKTGAIGEDGEPIGNAEDWVPKNYFGLTILESLWHDPELRDIPVVITSGMERDEIERRFATQGVWAFVEKDDLNKIRLKELLKDYGLLTDSKIIGHSLPLLECLREARRRARIPNDNILILGESGTEKELLADYIHQQSGKECEYVSFSYVSEETLETELSDDAVLADGGTLFIDKFGDIIATAQPEHLQFLKNIHNRNLRVITAIEREEILFEENFRKAFPDGALIHNFIRIPALSQREEDMPLLVKYFVKKYEKEFNAKSREVSVEALEVLTTYSWPGNVRELENVIKGAVSDNKDIKLLVKDHLNLPPEIHSPPISSDQPNSLDLFKIIWQDDLWEQFRGSLGGMAMWLQGTAIWGLTEKALRGAIATILSGRLGDDWIDSVSQIDTDLKNIFKGCEVRQKEYRESYPGKVSDSPDLINFTGTSHPFGIILHENLWKNHFREFFGGSDSEDNYWFWYWEEREKFILKRVRHLMHHSNPDLIKLSDHYTFKGYCGEILEICQKIENVPQERLYEGKVLALLGYVAKVQINEFSTLELEEFVQVPKGNFESEEDFKYGKVRFKVRKERQGCPVYDVFLVEPK